MSKMITSFVRCLHPIEHNARRSTLNGWDNITCGGLVHNTAGHRKAHAKEMHPGLEGHYSDPLEESHGNECRVGQSCRTRCDCGNEKSGTSFSCEPCHKLAQAHVLRIKAEGESDARTPEERAAARRDKRAEVLAQGLCASCYKRPIVQGKTKCAKCRGGFLPDLSE